MKHILRLLIFLLLLQFDLLAQYEIRVVNQKLTPETFRFDVVIRSLSTEALVMGSYQCIFNFNNSFYSGDSQFKYIEESSDLTNEPEVNTGIQSDEGIMKLCFAGSPGADTITSDYRRIGTFELTAGIPNLDSLAIQWSFDGNIETIIADADYNDITTPQTHYREENPLPVELVSFTAKQDEDIIKLNWETATELNCYGFEIERKRSEEKIFKTVDFIKSIGGSSNQKYTYCDKEVLATAEYIYRLKQIDNDGSYEYLKTVTVRIDKPLAFKLYQNFPNPFNPSTTIKYSLKEKSRVELNIYDITGKLIAKLFDNVLESGIYSYEWIADGFASGVYFCQLRTISNGNGEIFTSINKLILMK